MHRAKQQITGQLAISLESGVNEMMAIGRNHLFFDRVDTFETIQGRVNRLTAADIREAANELFRKDQFSMLTYLPKA